MDSLSHVPFPITRRNRDVHVKTTARAIASFVDARRAQLVCFRCGQQGHVRYQCMSYKVRMCWNYANGECNNPVCQFAHGEHELRTPWRVRCVRVIKHDGQFVSIGCNSTEHTFRRCPIHQDLMFV